MFFFFLYFVEIEVHTYIRKNICTLINKYIVSLYMYMYMYGYIWNIHEWAIQLRFMWILKAINGPHPRPRPWLRGRRCCRLSLALSQLLFWQPSRPHALAGSRHFHFELFSLTRINYLIFLFCWSISNAQRTLKFSTRVENLAVSRSGSFVPRTQKMLKR